jgi:hypothetical protein
VNCVGFKENIMKDREMLELAAAAAGFSDYFDGMIVSSPTDTFHIWNPITDDGDAMRLAVRLRIPVTFPFGEETVRTRYGEDGTEPIYLPLGRDPYAATRRSIVLASAEIGKSLK